MAERRRAPARRWMAALLLAALARGAEGEAVLPAVLLVVRATTGAGSFDAVVREALQWRLARAGLAVVLPDTVPAEVQAAAKRAECEFAVDASYRLEGQRLSLALDWYDVARGERAPPVTVAAALDFSLDKAIVDAADQMVSRASARISEEAEARRIKAEAAAQAVAAAQAAAAAAAPAREPATTAATAPASAEGASSAQAVEPPPATAALPQPAAAPAVPDLVPPQPSPATGGAPARFVVSAGVAPFFPVGKAADYFQAGFMPTLHGAFALRIGDWSMSLGLLTGAVLFHAEGAARASDNAIVPAGPAVGWYRNVTGPVAFVTRLSGGPALFVMREEGAAPLTKLLPYAMWSLGFAGGLGRSVTVGVELALAVFFEPAAPIVAYMPSIQLSLHR